MDWWTEVRLEAALARAMAPKNPVFFLAHTHTVETSGMAADSQRIVTGVPLASPSSPLGYGRGELRRPAPWPLLGGLLSPLGWLRLGVFGGRRLQTPIFCARPPSIRRGGPRNDHRPPPPGGEALPFRRKESYSAQPQHSAMQCPHCQIAFHSNTKSIEIGEDRQGGWWIDAQLCPACGNQILVLLNKMKVGTTHQGLPSYGNVRSRHLVWPKSAVRPLPPNEVPKDLSDDYIEAAMVLSDSPKASAALSRRCLQHLIRETIGIKKGTLSQEIDEVLKAANLPGHLSESIDAIRNIGNFSAHPTKDTSSGEILPVEVGEAEWNLDVLDGLFDFYFVQPEITKKRKAALDAKLATAGKPPTK
jgi:hypothetical protein